MYTYSPIRVEVTTTGLIVVICPRPGLLGVLLSPEGRPIAVKYPDRRYGSKTGYKTYTDLKGLNQEDYDRIKPDLVLYELKDGTLLQADRELCEKAELGSHNATSSGKLCFTHDVDKLVLFQMPEFDEPDLDLS